MELPIGRRGKVLALCPIALAFAHAAAVGATSGDARLPAGVAAVWDVARAYREATPTRERICINGLWRWQPAKDTTDGVPDGTWGYFKVPGCWPGITDYMQKDCQTVHAHPGWRDRNLRGIAAAWYQREITVPAEWAGRRIALRVDYLNSYAVVYVDGRKAGELRFPAGELDLTSVCRPGKTHVLSLAVVAMPLKAVMLSYSDTASAKRVKGSVARRGLCGDAFLVAAPRGPRIADVKVDTSVRKWQITFGVALDDLAPDAKYTLSAQLTDDGRNVGKFASKAFRKSDLRNGRIAFTGKWKPEKLWDIHTPGNTYTLRLSLLDAGGKVLDAGLPVRVGFREFWIDGRDFYLNGSRIFLSAVPLDNAQVGAAAACYAGARESLRRLKSFGINFVYGHNYGCQPGAHLSFEEVLRAADDVGMLVALSQPHFGHYDWKAADAEKANGYARHAAFYVRVAQNHPSVVAYATSHNATGSGEDMNPDRIGSAEIPRSSWSANNSKLAFRAEAIIRGLDPSRIVYHHAGDIGSLHASNFYPNFVPIQEMSDWFGPWAARGVKPAFLCEYGAPFSWDWSMYRGWYKGHREFGSAPVPWEFCLAEWNAQFLGDRAFRISERERENLRWEAGQFRSGALWHRWDYPHVLGSRDFDERHPVFAAYITDNWRAFRTWGLSASSPWEHRLLYRLRDGVDTSRKPLPVDWARLQRPGLSPDYVEDRYQRMDLAFERSDWVPTPSGLAILRNNGPLLAYLAGKPGSFTSKDHNFLPGEAVAKQIVVINNSRETVVCDCRWSLGLPRPAGGRKEVRVPTGRQVRIPLRFDLPEALAPGAYRLDMTASFGGREPQKDSLAVHVLPRPPKRGPTGKIALFDPKGETGKLLAAMGVACRPVGPRADLSSFDALIVGKAALTADGPAPDVRRVRDGLRVLVFEQTSEALEKRLGFRVQEYGLRNVFRRVPDHPALGGLDEEHLRDWRGEATLLPPRRSYEASSKYGGHVVRRCGLEVPRLWRCGNRGSVASVLIEKPACGDFLPIVDGGFSLQYSPLLECREGAGMVLFCQMDVTGRAEDDPAAGRLVRNLLGYVSSWKPAPRRRALYAGDPAGRAHLESAGVSLGTYEGGRLSGEQVLVVGRGGGRALRPHAPDVARWLKAGGHLLALELDGAEASTFLPKPVRTTRREHIAAWFPPFGVGSLLAGVSPADVHNRDARELPLVSGGAAVVGNGVLARSREANVVFCQLAPHRVSKARGAVPSLAVSADDAAAGERSALLTMGSVAWGQFGQKVKAGKVGKTYTFAVFVQGVGEPVRARLEVERAGSPWDRAVRGKDTLIPADTWSELHVTFRVAKPYPEGWSAYIHCDQEGARLRADGFRLCEGGYVPRRGGARAAKAAGGGNLFANPSFEAGTKPWWFNWKTQRHNVRRTYRRASFLVTRLLANMGVAGKTPLLSRLATPASGPVRESVVKNGDFGLDKDGDSMPDHWQFTAAGPKKATCALQKAAPPGGKRCLRITCPGFGKAGKGSVMLAQHDVPVRQGQWYRISLRAKAEGLRGARVTLAVQDTVKWRALIEYQRFAPGKDWREFTFLVPGAATAASRTRFQIWHGSPGTLWLADVVMSPCEPPGQGRWLTGLYLDRPVEWDDPYRFFRW